MSNSPSSPTRNTKSRSKENLAFHSLLRWKMIIIQILATSLMHFLLKGWENVLFELRSGRVNWNSRLSDAIHNYHSAELLGRFPLCKTAHTVNSSVVAVRVALHKGRRPTKLLRAPWRYLVPFNCWAPRLLSKSTPYIDLQVWCCKEHSNANLF